MPKPTFFNLPAEKRDRFVDAALDEFAGNPYDQASVSAIVTRLGIAKGSVYQYFEDKFDLFSWLVEEAGRRKAAAVAVASPADGSFFELLRASYAAGMRLWVAEPRWARVTLRMMEPTREPRLEAIRRGGAQAGHAWLREQIERARLAGELRPSVDPDDAAHLIHGLLSEGLMRAWLGRAGVELSDLVAEPGLADSLVEGDFHAAVDQALALIRHGLLVNEATPPA